VTKYINFVIKSINMLGLLALTALVSTGCLPSDGIISATSKDLASVPALPDSHPPVTPPDMTASKATLTSVKLQVGNRLFVESVLRNVFLNSSSSATATTEFKVILEDTVLRYPSEFGGPVSPYTTRGFMEIKGNYCGFGCSNETDIDIPIFVPASQARSSIVSEACQRLLDRTTSPFNDVFLNTALQNLAASPTVAPSESEIKRIPDLFAPGFENDPVLIEKALLVQHALNSSGIAPREQWRGVVMTFCESPFWQTL
jgi:hypothetical protein